MDILLITIFALSYAAIAFEHPFNINKSAPALIGAGLLWTIYALNDGHAGKNLHETVSGTAEIIFFLMGAMTIVEVIDAHDGFDVITDKIKTTKMTTLLWLVGFVTFFLSAVLDNLTTTIVMISVVRKLLGRREDKLFFAGIIVIAANAGGAWSPLGDVTTTMLWIGGQVTAFAIIKGLFLPSLVNMVLPLLIVNRMFRDKQVIAPDCSLQYPDKYATNRFEKNFIFFAGIAALCSVPIFKTVTHLPPFMGILFALGIIWLLSELIHRNKNDDDKQHLSLASALQRIDMASLVFFIGILLAVAVLEHTHILTSLAQWLDQSVGNQATIVMLFGLASAVIDNVPLVAASMGMYPLTQFPADSFIWEFLAYAAGTGGSMLIIGSAAGVAAMGLEKIEFLWYLRKISLLALVGYLGGAVIYIILGQLLIHL
ncbi:MAG TPA: sodium:proton antiporter NhaD [Methylophilus sp.]|nr:sodium:proton antiporter NhaD [Methylophilus sp.]HQQ33161.1 sodium:proton antiporter NhaD [Methylophilus sp.]